MLEQIFVFLIDEPLLLLNCLRRLNVVINLVNVVFVLNCVYEPRDLFDDDGDDDVNVLIMLIYEL